MFVTVIAVGCITESIVVDTPGAVASEPKEARAREGAIGVDAIRKFVASLVLWPLAFVDVGACGDDKLRQVFVCDYGFVASLACTMVRSRCVDA